MVQRTYDQPARLDPNTGLWGSDEYIPPADQIVINGIGFGTKSSAPAIWEPFAGTVGQLVKDYDPLWIGFNGSPGAIISDLDARYPGHKAAYHTPDRGGDFWTNFKQFSPSRFVRLSMWIRVHSYRGANLSGGVTKFQRVNDPTVIQSGVTQYYNGPGVVTCGGSLPNNWFGSWTGSENELNGIGYLDENWFPMNAWRRVEYELKMNDLDVANGYQNIYVDRFGSVKSGNIMQRKSGYQHEDLSWGSTLLGIESPNQYPYYAPNVLLANTDYAITKNSVTYTYNSPTIPTVANILSNLGAQLTAAGFVVRIWNNAEINIDGANGATFSSNFTKAPTYGMSVSEIVVDTDPELKAIYIGDAATWASCSETNPLVYVSWTNTRVVGSMPNFASTASANRYAYKQLTPNTTPVLIGQLVSDGSGGWEVTE